MAPVTPPVVDDGAEISVPGAHACTRACCAVLLVIIGMKIAPCPILPRATRVKDCSSS